MSQTAIQVRDISKRYRIGAAQEPYRTLRETLAGAVAAPFRRLANLAHRVSSNGDRHHVWALDQVAFEVNRGDTVGIIGRNGAGKTTLLKVLSRITEPTRGSARIYGRVGSLLEVGTGFHPELTGRENIYLNGAILGMRKAEIRRKFDEIVDFAEVEKFIDTPVKRYSSGMHTRLAFAVAAHLETEILMVDEVLAVGDSLFQKKCLGKMEDVAKHGRTVLFVSHNMGAVRSLCRKGIVLNHGRVVHIGDVGQAIETYFRTIGALPGSNGHDDSGASGSGGYFGPIILNGGCGSGVHQSQPIRFSTTLRIPDGASGYRIHCILEDMLGRRIFQLREDSSSLDQGPSPAGDYAIAVETPPLWLSPGMYSVCFKLKLWSDSNTAVHFSDRYPVDVDGTSSIDASVLCPRGQWSVQSIRRS
jgi:lipopolysaccharide transport system ATP-binding protein